MTRKALAVDRPPHRHQRLGQHGPLVDRVLGRNCVHEILSGKVPPNAPMTSQLPVNWKAPVDHIARTTAAVLVLALAGCGSSATTTTTISPAQAIIENEITSTPLCADVLSGDVPPPKDNRCRDIPTCPEAEAGAALPANHECIDVTKP